MALQEVAEMSSFASNPVLPKASTGFHSREDFVVDSPEQNLYFP